MSLQFIGDVGIYVPDKDAVKFTAIDDNLTILCYARRSTLIALGCEPMDDAAKLCAVFERQRGVFERTAAEIHEAGGTGDIVIRLRDLRQMKVEHRSGGEGARFGPSRGTSRRIASKE